MFTEKFRSLIAPVGQGLVQCCMAFCVALIDVSSVGNEKGAYLRSMLF